MKTFTDNHGREWHVPECDADVACRLGRAFPGFDLDTVAGHPEAMSWMLFRLPYLVWLSMGPQAWAHRVDAEKAFATFDQRTVAAMMVEFLDGVFAAHPTMRGKSYALLQAVRASVAKRMIVCQ